ncbi:MAG: hypothetical protein BWY15_01792 [Firmicutes bacterium ADurb.Bin193]|nr:MAG: hypothetical protein BWY15_01792 [Firmicutes bacterium ADurb.Bin193]
MRVMAINMEDNLFDELKEHVKENGLTLKEYITDIVRRDLAQQTQQQEATLPPMKWEKEDVIRAIDDFIEKNDRVPVQKEFKSENGLPSYGAALRCLEQPPSEYCKERFKALSEQSGGMSMNM